jgi:uncharacterized protein YjgD (DUF1641 family)
MVFYSEPHIVERMEAAKAKAAKVKSMVGVESDEDVENALRFIISRHYNIPFFDSYFDNLTIDQLAFESYLITDEKKEVAQKVEEHQKEEVSEIMDNFEEFLNTSEQEDAEFLKMAENFMETGNFVGEGETSHNMPPLEEKPEDE